MAQDTAPQAVSTQQLRRELQHCEERLRSLILHNADGILIVDPEGIVRFANPTAAQLLNRSLDQLQGQPFGYPIAVGKTTEIDLRRASLPAGSAEMRVIETVWDDQPACLVSLHDITEHRQTEVKIRRLNRMYAVLAQVNATVARERSRAALLDEICRIAIEQGQFCLAWVGVLEADNQSFRPVTLRATTEQAALLDLPAWANLSPLETVLRYDRSEVCNDIRADLHLAGLAQTGCQSLMSIPLHAHSRVFGVLTVCAAEPNFFDLAERQLLEEIGLSVSYALDNIEREAQRRQVQAELKQSEERYKELAETLPQAVVESDLTGRITYANHAAYEISGYLPENVGHGLNLFDLLYPPDRKRAYANLQRVLHGEPSRGNEYIAQRPDGSTYPVLIYTALTIRDGHPIGLRGVVIDITERKRAEKLLYEANQRWEAIIQSSPLAILVADPQGLIQLWNPAAERMFGWRADEVLGHFNPIIPADRIAEFLDSHQRALRGEIIQPAEVRRQRKDGTPIDLLMSRAPLYDEQGIASGAVAILADITDRKQAEAAEREQRTLAEALRDTAAALSSTLNFDEVLDRILENVGKIVPNDNTSILLIDGREARFVRMRGYLEPGTEADVLAYRFNVDTTPDLRDSEVSGRAFIIPNVTEYPHWLPVPGRDWIRSHLSIPIRIKGQTVGYLSLGSATPGFFIEQHADHLEIFAAQAAVAIENAQLYEQVHLHAEGLEQSVALRTAELDRERQRLRTILDSAGDGIFFTDAQGTLEYLNPAMERLTGYTSAEALGHNPSLWRSGRTPAHTFEEMWRTITRGHIWRGEVVNRRKDDTLFDMALIVSPLLAESRQILGYVAVAHDITQRKELDRLKDQFVANVSHELRTPLTNVKLYLGLLDHGPLEKRAQYLQTLRREATRLESLIENLLSISRLDMGKTPIELEPIDVNAIISQLAHDRAQLIAERGLTLNVYLGTRLPAVLASSMLVSQIVANLLTNAMQYTPPGGDIIMSATVVARNDQNWVTINVTDTGPGIASHDLPHLFERFYRGEAAHRSGLPGTGLGLAICAEIAKQLDGHITVESQPGKGATFVVWLKPAQSIEQDEL